MTVAVSEQADRDLLPDGAATERTVRFGAGAATTALTVALENDRIAEPDGDLTVAVQAGAGYTPGDPSSATVTVEDGDTDTAPPTVTSVVVASTPHSGDTYRWGETIVFTVTFSEPVRVMGRPGLEVGLDNPAGASGSTVRAGFWGLSETEQVTIDSWPVPVSRYVHFGYSVQPFDRDADGVSVGANALRLASGDRIQSDETDTYAEFDHAALAPQRGHQVDGRETVDGEPTAPVAGAGITFVDTDGDPLELLANGTHRLSVPDGGEARYGLRLKTRPAHKVVVSHHYHTYGGDSDLTVPRNFSFDGSIAPDTWDTKTAWVKVAAAQDDDAEDGERVFDNRAFSRDPNYHDLVLPDVVVVEADDDDEEKGSSQGGAAEPLTAAFEGLPEAHDGETAFTFRIVFSEAVSVTPEAMRTRVLTVAGGAVTGAARVDGETGVWAITVTPDTREALSISLPLASDCDTDGAVCTSDGRALSIGAAHIVNGPADQPERNTSATGTPTIGGTPQVGERLTASTAGIADEDGLDNATFTYQWLADDADISGATGSTYTLVDGDEGQTIKVRVSFTDDAGNEEELTSGATDAVAAPEPPAKPTGLSATPSHDRVVLTWDDPNDDTITGYVILRRNRDTDAQGQFTELEPDTGSAATTYTDDSVAAGTPYTYRIKAINGHGVSERSRWFHIDTPAAPTPEPTPEPESVSEGDTDLPNDNSTPGRVAVGGSATGAIGTPGDQDRFAVELVAGRTYQFDLTGSPGGGGTLPDTFFRAIYNSEGQYQADSYNDDFDGGRDSRVTFTPTESGTYYARVSGDRDEVGSYTLSVTDVTPQ